MTMEYYCVYKQIEYVINSQLKERFYLISRLFNLTQHFLLRKSQSSGHYSCFVYAKSLVPISARKSAILAKVFRRFPQFFKEMLGHYFKSDHDGFLHFLSDLLFTNHSPIQH
jgi:hypothetical protein